MWNKKEKQLTCCLENRDITEGQCARSRSQWTQHIAFANDTYDTSLPDMRARMCVDTWGRARNHAEGRGAS